MAAGVGLVTNGVARGVTASKRCFPDARGFSVGITQSGKATYEPQDSDVVCFRSAAADADGLHSLVEVANGGYALQPLSTATVESVQEAGEWEANGIRVNQRLITVGVAFRA